MRGKAVSAKAVVGGRIERIVLHIKVLFRAVFIMPLQEYSAIVVLWNIC